MTANPAPPTLPLSVWPVAQRTARGQRAGRYLEISGNHPAKMLPAIAQRAITTYTQPGDITLDPMCGIGTTLVEAIYLGRDAVGVEYEQPWADLARANVELARSKGATGHAEVFTGDARYLETTVDPALQGLVALVVTSPPYGASLHGQVRARPGQGVAKSHERYSRDPENLAHQSFDNLLGGSQPSCAGARPCSVLAASSSSPPGHGDAPASLSTCRPRCSPAPRTPGSSPTNATSPCSPGYAATPSCPACRSSSSNTFARPGLLALRTSRSPMRTSSS